MRWPALAIGLSGTLCALFAGTQTPPPVKLIVTGEFDGRLAPCGCTSPMTGGIMRSASLIRRVRQSASAILVSNGALAIGYSRQDEMKTQTIGEYLGAMNVSAVSLTSEDARRGIGSLLTIQNLTNGALISGSVQPTALLTTKPDVVAGPFLIGDVSAEPAALARSLGTTPIDARTAVTSLLSAAKEQGLAPILLLDGNEEEGRALATQFPDLRLIVYRSSSDPPRRAPQAGSTLLVSPGPFGKYDIVLSYDGGRFNYEPVSLTPDLKDDPETRQFMTGYLKAIDTAGFLDQIPRRPSKTYAGSRACASCHSSAYAIWAGSVHAKGLRSLEAVGHARDPDCVACHVVGLQNKGGFRSRAATPGLASVGCESCHGPGEAHVRRPTAVRMPKVSLDMCSRCHTSEQSPNFRASTYWALIRHR